MNRISDEEKQTEIRRIESVEERRIIQLTIYKERCRWQNNRIKELEDVIERKEKAMEDMRIEMEKQLIEKVEE